MATPDVAQVALPGRDLLRSTAIRPTGPLDSPEQIDGRGLETLVFQELRAAISYRSLKLDRFFWRTAPGAEVDFVAYGGDGLFAIEEDEATMLLTPPLATCSPAMVYGRFSGMSTSSSAS